MRLWLLGLAAAAVVLGGVFVWRLSLRVDEFIASRAAPPIRVYGGPLQLRAGLDLAGVRLVDRLRRLGYEENPGGDLEGGQFRPGRQRFDIMLRPYLDPDGKHPPDAIRLEAVDGIVQSVRRLGSGEELAAVPLEPELLGTYAGGVLGERRPLRLDDLPKHLLAAVLAAEDARFARHPGIDPLGVVRAAWVNLRGGSVRQGGSTITQQLAKNLFLTPARTFSRKVREGLLAFLLELRLTKEEILEAYLNSVYLGQSRSLGISGINQGALAFFGKDPRQLTVGESATIAGILQAPNATSPLRHPERARARRDQVLDLMAENGWLSAEDVAKTKAEPVKLSKLVHAPLEAPFFVDEVLRRVERMGYDPRQVRGLSVYTSLDLELQRTAERALAGGLDALEREYARFRRADDPLEGAVMVLDARSGYVLALVGGRDFARSQFNRVTRSKRQPGSAFKPFVYLAALDDPDDPITPSTVFRDAPLRIWVGRDEWAPENYDGRYLGEVTVRAALEGSRNVPTVGVAERVGFHRIAELARTAGLGEIPAVPALALGVGEVSLIDLVGAYSVFPNQGLVVRPALIRGVLADDGNVLYRDEVRAKRVATAPAAFVTSHLLEGVVQRGTAASARRLGLTRTAAGKTGTTNDFKDAWFVGYSPDLVSGVWVGFDDGTPVGLTGAKAALPIWVSLMREALKAHEDRPFPAPPGVVFRDVDRHSGLLTAWSCPESIHESFVVGTEPTLTCDGRRVQQDFPFGGKAANWLERLFGRP